MSKTLRLDAAIEDLKSQRADIEGKLATLYQAMSIVRLDYDEDQPRDESGRWASGGGGGGIAKAERGLTGAGSSSPPKSSTGPSKGLKEIGERLGRDFKHTGMPDKPEKYFNTDKPGTKMVPVDKLLTIRARSKGIENAEKHMMKAYEGEGGKRDPISVSLNPDGTYSVEDGNSTTAIARKHGWKEIPVEVVPQSDKGKTAFKEHKIQSALDDIKDLQNDGKLPKDVSLEKHREIAEKELEKHNASLEKFRSNLQKVTGVEFMGRTKELDSALGKVVRKPKYGTVDKLQDLTGVRTVTSSVKQSKEVAARLAKEYNVPAKNIEEKLTPEQVREGGYRAIHMIVRDHDGLEKEVQIQTERQRAFQKWSHDVYKPQTAEQEAAVGTESKPGPHRKEALAYGDAVSLHFYQRDLGEESQMPPEPHPVIAKVFGVPTEVSPSRR